jgi:uroporphyrinogen-III synthase
MPIGSRSLVVAQEKLALEGFEVLAEIVYQNLPLPLNDSAKAEVSSEAVDFVLFRSPSSARAYFALQGLPARLVISVGATTTAAIRELGFSPDLVCLETAPSSVAKKIAEYQAKRMPND